MSSESSAVLYEVREPVARLTLQAMLTIDVGTKDAIEGVKAFLDKREPQWKGR